MCLCSEKYAGSMCELECINGTNQGTGICQCSLPCITGLRCDHECSHNGVCNVNGNCDCDFFAGYKGPQCDKHRCPGWPQDCSGHGTCNEAVHQCDCEPGWKGEACHIPQCLGTPECNGVMASCQLGEGEKKPRCFNCQFPFIGDACELRCVHGLSVRYMDGRWECSCDPCYVGPSCESECTDRGTCNVTLGLCNCGYTGGRGERCQINGCPGWEIDCTGHGTCNSVTGLCTCNIGWSGKGCDQPSCPQNCNYHGKCVAEGEQPVCHCQSGYFGTACQYHCVNGIIKNGECACEPCFSGPFCDVACSRKGVCTGGSFKAPCILGKGPMCP